MVELIGDPCIPSELIVPTREVTPGTATPELSGALYLSGGKLNFWTGTQVEVISSCLTA